MELYMEDINNHSRNKKYSYIPLFKPQYEKFKFISIEQPKNHDSNNNMKKNEVYINDIKSLLKIFNADSLDWEKLINSEYEAPEPNLGKLPPPPEKPKNFLGLPNLAPIPEKPKLKVGSFRNHYLEINFPLGYIMINFSFNFLWKIRDYYALSDWEAKLQKINIQNTEIQKQIDFFKENDKEYKRYQQELSMWNKFVVESELELKKEIQIFKEKKTEFCEKNCTQIKKIIALKENYFKREKLAIEEFLKLILLNSPYPNCFPRNFEIDIDYRLGIVIVDIELPDFEKIKILEHDKRNNLREIMPKCQKIMRENSLYGIIIRTLYEIAHSDEINFVDAIVVNGFINYTDRSSGNEKNSYILSIFAKKQDIIKINIRNVDPKECFKLLKGVSAKNFIEYIPISPIMTMNRTNVSIIEGRAILDQLDSEENLAAMDWNDFEHLIRELFEKEFSQDGVEVKITQASRDRGIDAIIYDPNPIKGGKIIVQAKRYTKAVDVSAVRDLYGTILNEGANKGILVTTSHYGSDSYDFSKNKNITLLTGENLLYLLNKHGYKFKIDMEEARKLINPKLL
jgi:restriction system protein